MDIVSTYLQQNWERLDLKRFGAPFGLSCVMLTPGFVASSHIIAFVLKNGFPQPFLVVKFPRVSGDHGRLDRETDNLNRFHRLWKGGLTSAPTVVAYEDFAGHRLLVETMVKGDVMRRSLVRSQEQTCLSAGLIWLKEMNRATAVSSESAGDWFDSLISSRLAILQSSFPLSNKERQLIERSRELVEPLREAAIPLVFEHGDFSAPNILIDGQNNLGVVDWELAEPLGLPLADLTFFLSYIAFCRERAEKLNQYVKAFHNAFFESKGWAQPYIRSYSEEMGLSPELLRPLFVLSWVRYLGNMVARLKGSEAAGKQLAEQTVTWLRKNRYYRIWQHTVENASSLNL